MRIILLISIIKLFLFPQDCYFSDGEKIVIEITNYGILVDEKYKLKLTDQFEVYGGDIESIFQNKYYKYSFISGGSNCDFEITNKNTKETFSLFDSKPVTHRIVMFKDSAFFGYHTQFSNLEDCRNAIKDYNNREDLRKRGFIYKCENIN